MTQVVPSEEPSAFDSLIEHIGNAGKYQKLFNFTFNFLLVIVAAMPHLNLVMSLATPSHWCYVPGRESTNYSIEEWKNLTIPVVTDSRGLPSYAKCERYAIPNLSENGTAVSSAVISCDLGWEFDHTWYDLTAPMQNNWVCDKAIITANTIAIGRVGEVVGTLVFGQLADNYGRKPIFFATVVTLVLGRSLSALTSSWVYLFYIFSVVGSLPSTSVFQGPLIIAMEISRAEDRAFISMMQCFGWNTGLVVMPLLLWWLRDWVPFLLLTSLPCTVFLFSWPWMIESPRWLASRGKIKQCVGELGKIANYNKTQLPSHAETTLRKSHEARGAEKSHTVLALFSSLRLAKNTLLLITCWSILLLIYMCLAINVHNLGGNPFLNYLLQAIAEIPAYMLGKFVSDRFGRRWTSLASFCLTAIACIPVIFVVNDISSTLVISCMCIFLRFSVSLAFYSVNLQSMEIYPTCVRQTGISVGVIVGSAIGVLSPYIITLGLSVNAMLPYIIYLITSVLAGVCCIFLPETYGHQLPESLADANEFGADQDFWGKTKQRKNSLCDGAEVPLKK